MTAQTRAIVKMCMECKHYNINHVRLCGAVNCPLHPHRLGVEIKNKMEVTKNGNSQTG